MNLIWRTSSYSQGCSNCVQVAGSVAVRDSKDPAGGQLSFSPAAWTAWTARLRGPKTCPTPDACFKAGSCLHGCVQGP